MTDRTFLRAIIAVVVAAAMTGCGSSDPDKFIASAETYIAKANYAAASIELKNALSKAPDNARARYLLGKVSLETGDAAAAATELRKALALNYPADEAYPQLARALVEQGASQKDILELGNAPVQSAHAKAEIAAMIGIAHMGLQQPKEARARIEAAIALEPSNVNARIASAQLAAVENNPTGALVILDEVIATAPDNIGALMLKGNLDMSLGKRSDAVTTFERVVALRPETVGARYGLIWIFIQSKELDKAAAQVDEVKKRAPADVRTMHAVAFLAFARGDTTTALSEVQKALQAAPDYLPARYLAGLVDLQRGDYVSAENSLSTVVARAPNDDGARIALAQAYLRRSQPAKARDTLEPALRRQADNTSALRLAAEIQLALKRPDQSAEYLERANALDKGDISSRVRLAEVRLAKGDSGQGIRDLEALSASDPNKTEPDLALIAAHLRARDYAKALAAADALVKKQPSSAAAYNAKGAVYVAKGDLKGARPAFEKAVSLDPDFATASLNLASLDGAERNFAGAKARYEQILAKDPKSDQALLGLAEILIITNSPPAEVTAAIERAIAAKPDSVAARLKLIGFKARQKDWTATIAAAQAAQAAIPDNPQLLEALASAQQAAGERNQAIETFDRIARLQPGNPLPLMRIAGIHASLKNYGSAIASLKSALAVAPDNSTIWVALAATYMESNQVDSGFAEARKRQSEQPNRAAGFALEAELLGAQKKFPEAAAAYRTALARQPLPFSAIRLHALLTVMGKPDEAAAVTQKWLKDHPKDVQVRTYLAQRSLVAGDFKAAAQSFRAALEYEPDNVIVLNNLAWSLSELNDAKAIEYAERAYRIAPNMAEVADTFGWILVQRGDTAQGIELLRKAVDLAPDDPDKRLHLAKALIKSGDKPGARKELETVAKADSAAARTQAEQLLKDL